MKKIIYLLLVVVGLTTPQHNYAQSFVGLDASISYDDSPVACEGGGCVFLTIFDTTSSGVVITNPSYVWTKIGGTLPANFSTNPYAFGSASMCGLAAIDSGCYKIDIFDGTTMVYSKTLKVSVTPYPSHYSVTGSFTCANYQVTIAGGVGVTLADFNSASLPNPYTFIFAYDPTTPQPSNYGLVIKEGGCKFDLVRPYPLWETKHSPTVKLSKDRNRAWFGHPAKLSATTAWTSDTTKTKWFKNGLLYATGGNTLSVSDSGLYKVQLKVWSDSLNHGTVCYKVKSVTIKGKLTTARLSDDSEDEMISSEKTIDLQVGPNPASSQIMVSGYDDHIEIYDVNGRMVASIAAEEDSAPVTISVAELPGGLYFVRSGDQTQKVMVEK